MFNYKEYVKQDIIYSDEIMYNTNKRIDIYYKNKIKKKIIIRTPIMNVPFDIKVINGNYIVCVSFSRMGIDKDNEHFYNFITYLDKLINKLFKQKQIPYRKNIIEYKNFCKYMSFLVPKQATIYDVKNELTNFSINKNSEIALIIELVHVQYNDTESRCVWNVIQIKDYSCINVNKCLFIDDDDIIVEPLDSSFDKYIKMIKMGIPICAIKNNMIIGGFEQNDIDKLPDMKDNFIKGLHKIKIKSDVQELIGKPISLKKAETNKHVKLIKQTGFAPSLVDILNIKNGLKSITTDN